MVNHCKYCGAIFETEEQQEVCDICLKCGNTETIIQTIDRISRKNEAPQGNVEVINWE